MTHVFTVAEIVPVFKDNNDNPSVNHDFLQ